MNGILPTSRMELVIIPLRACDLNRVHISSYVIVETDVVRRNLTGCQCLKKIRVFRPEPHSVKSANAVLKVYQNLRIYL